MEWLKKLENYNVSFYIHTLHKEDSILIKSANENSQTIYVLDGFSQLLQIFTNNEKICIGLLRKSQMITSGKNYVKNNAYHMILTAITETKVITIPSKELNRKLAKNTGLFSSQLFHDCNRKHEIISILSHKNTRKRIVQLLIVLIKQLGEIKGHEITLPLHLSHQTIADITGSQRITVNRVMSSLKQNRIISYSSKSITIRRITKLIQG